jgi:putative addiction module component (TIGR02574 family)
MSSTKDTVITQALTLSEADRLDVIERLSESLSSAADAIAAWDTEIDRRLDNVASGRAKFQSWEEARRLIAGEQDATKS